MKSETERKTMCPAVPQDRYRYPIVVELNWNLWDDLTITPHMKSLNTKEIYTNDTDFDKIPDTKGIFSRPNTRVTRGIYGGIDFVSRNYQQNHSPREADNPI